MADGEERKRYGLLMSEHERRVNDKDIKAYEGHEKKIYGVLPGFGGRRETEMQQKLIEGSLGRSSPSTINKKADIVI